MCSAGKLQLHTTPRRSWHAGIICPAMSGRQRGWSLTKQLHSCDKRRGVSAAVAKQIEQSTQQRSTAGILQKQLALDLPNYARLMQVCREQGTGVPLAYLHRDRHACSHQGLSLNHLSTSELPHRSASYDCDHLPTANMCLLQAWARRHAVHTTAGLGCATSMPAHTLPARRT